MHNRPLTWRVDRGETNPCRAFEGATRYGGEQSTDRTVALVRAGARLEREALVERPESDNDQRGQLMGRATPGRDVLVFLSFSRSSGVTPAIVGPSAAPVPYKRTSIWSPTFSGISDVANTTSATGYRSVRCDVASSVLRSGLLGT